MLRESGKEKEMRTMFAIGEAKSKVTNAKVIMPSEYRLKSKTLFGDAYQYMFLIVS